MPVRDHQASGRHAAVSQAAQQRTPRRLRLPVTSLDRDHHLAANVFPEAAEQRCWNHKIRNVLDRLPKRAQEQARELLTSIPYSETYELAERRRDEFAKRFGTAWPEASATLERDWDRMTTFYALPQEHRKHLRTTNIVESVTFRCSPAPNGCQQALQAGSQRQRPDLEAPVRRGEELQTTRPPGNPPGRGRGSPLRERSPSRTGP
jgi:hypothetical protein